MQLASYLEGSPLMWMMLLHLHVNLNADDDYPDDDDDDDYLHKRVSHFRSNVPVAKLPTLDHLDEQ